MGRIEFVREKQRGRTLVRCLVAGRAITSGLTAIAVRDGPVSAELPDPKAFGGR